MKGEQERILCAAVHYDDGVKYVHQPKNIEIGVVICGLRHCVCFEVMGKALGMGNYDKGKIKQGFLTSHNRYVDREEALAIAIAAKQVPGRQRSFGLDSSDLY